MSGDQDDRQMTDEEWTEAMFVAAMEEANAPSKKYVHFDEREDVLSSLELLTVVAPLVGLRPQLWKWMIVGAQSALQGAMVCALVDSTGTSVLKKKSAAKMLDYLQGHKEGAERPEEWLEDFDKLLAKCEAQLGLALHKKQRIDITNLHRYFRNSFIHFTPKGWGIEKAGLPRIIGAAVDAVETLMETDRMGVRLEDFQSARLRSSLSDIRTSLATL
jgi:phage terminase small subunit